MHRPLKTLAAVVGSAILVFSWASAASAACVDPAAILKQRTSLPGTVNRLVPRLADPGASFSGREDDDDASIVGLWQFVFTSQGNNVAPLFIPDGAPLDAGYAQWHSDQTEIMNSSRDPATSNFCLGVWASTGKRSYKLNHFALSWDNTGMLCKPPAGTQSCFVGPTNIREQVTVNRRGDAYGGTVTIDQYDSDGKQLFHLQGTVSAHRITAD